MDQSLPVSNKGRRRREQILTAAMEAFAVHGSRSVSLASIAQTVGITEQGVMHYFPTKVHLLLGVLERRDERDTHHFLRLAQEDGLSLLEVLVEVMRFNATEPELATLYGVLMAESVDPDHPAHAWFAARSERVRQQIADGLAQAQRTGEVRADLDPQAVASQIIALFDGLAMQRALAAGELDVVSVFEAYIRSLSPNNGERPLGPRRSDLQDHLSS
jgi:AcrR family transcriptional regulator